MNQTIAKLTDVERNNIISAIDFLVPYVHSIVKISSEVDLPLNSFKQEMTDLYLDIDFFFFSIYLIYVLFYINF